MALDTNTSPSNRGMPKDTFSQNTYNVTHTQYPIDLFKNDTEYGGNYVIFYINIAQDSKLLKGNTVTTINGNISPRIQSDLVGLNLSNKQLIEATGTAGAFTGAVAGGIFSGNAIRGALKGALLGGVAGIAATGVATDNESQLGTQAGRQNKRLDHAIALHIPNQLNINYSMEWQTDETFAFQAAAVSNREIAKAIASGTHKDVDNDSRVKETLGTIAQSIALSKTPGMAGALSAATGLAANPKKEQIFKSVNFREFTFDYTFSPRSPEEAQAVRNIIYMFKLHMHPEYKDANNFIFLYPSEFDIYYYQGGKENLNIHRHPSCVLKNMSINYTPNGAFNTFDDGMPTQINVQLQFVELAILTKETIQSNF